MKKLAIWNPSRGLWENPTGGVDLFSEHSEPFWETWPISGMTRSGVAFVLPTPELPTDASEFSSSPIRFDTPDTMPDMPNSGSNRKAQPAGLGNQVRTLPTPQAHDAVRGKTPEQVAKMRARGHGVSNLNEVVFPTPTTQDAANTGGVSQGLRNTPPSITSLTLFPTPVAAEGTKGSATQGSARKGLTGQVWLTNVAHDLQPSGESTNPR